MAKSPPNKSIFRASGFSKTIEQAKQEIQELYCADGVPWVIGYSGGKDSSAVLQLTWLALAHLPAEKRTKPVHVISTDTLVENPVVAAWVNTSLDSMRLAAGTSGLPITPHKLTPETNSTFWVNLIGRGYPAPRNKFRWCTDRMKISPSNNFIRSVVRESGEAILLLGTRKAESSKRHANMKRHAARGVRDRLTTNSRLTNCLVYTPIEDWTNDDVWMFLMQIKNPWGHSNKELLTMYRGATEDGDCPLVVDESTPSCGSSRFGCWVCTLVDQDKSMAAMIQNDVEKEWMTPLLEFRNKLDFRGDEARTLERSRRDYRRLTGQLTYQVTSVDGPKLVHGPYTQDARAHWLKELLETQELVRELAPEEIKASIELIRLEELEEIRRIWVIDKHEIEDLLPAIYEEATGHSYAGRQLDDSSNFDADSLELLRSLCTDDLQYEMIRNLLDVERQHRNQARRKYLFRSLEDVIQRCFYESEDDALARARALHEAKHATLDDDDRFEDHAYLPTIEGRPLESSGVHS